VHQQVNAKTQDLATLPDHKTASEIMSAISSTLWNINNEPKQRYYHDYWNNPSGRSGVRQLRVRCEFTAEVRAVTDQVQKFLHTLPEGCYKTYFWSKWRHDHRIFNVVIYYRSDLRYDPNKHGAITASNIRYMQRYVNLDVSQYLEGQDLHKAQAAQEAYRAKLPQLIAQWEVLTGRTWQG
jgi:hypothetical protein